MSAAKHSPIFSTLADDPKAGDEIDAFVVALAERVDEIQDCEARADHAELAERAALLSAQSTRVGYEPLASAAKAVGGAALEGDEESAHKAVVELTELSQRVRLGHRGAL